MALKLNDLRSETRTLELQWQGEGGGDLNIVYYPSRLTPGVRLSLLAGAEAYQSGKRNTVGNIMEGWGAYCADLCALIASWDLLGDDDKPLPLTPEVLLTLPHRVLTDLSVAIVRDAGANPQTGVALPATSPRMG